MRKSDFVSIGSEIKTNTKLTARDDFDNLYVTEDDDPNFFGFGLEDEDGEEEKPKKKKKKKKPKAGSSRVTAPADTPKVQPAPSGRTKPATPAVSPSDRPVSSGKRPGPAGPKLGSPTDGQVARQPAGPKLGSPDNSQAARQPASRVPNPNYDGKRPKAEGAKLAQKLNRLPIIGPIIGVVLVGGDAVRILSDWIAYTQGGAVLSSQPPYITPCKNPNYDGFDDPFVDYYIDNEAAIFKLDYKGVAGVMSHNVKAFTPRLADFIYGAFPTYVAAAATSSLLLRGIGLAIAASSPVAGPGLPVMIISGLISAGVGWLASIVITRLLKKYDQWGPDASKLVAQFIMDRIVIDACSNAVYEAAQGDDPRDEEDTSSEQFANIDDFAAMSVDTVFKDILKDIQAELQDDPAKMSEFKQAFTKAKADAKQLLAKA